MFGRRVDPFKIKIGLDYRKRGGPKTTGGGSG